MLRGGTAMTPAYYPVAGFGVSTVVRMQHQPPLAAYGRNST